MQLTVKDLDFSGMEQHYAVFYNDGWECYGVYQYLSEAKKACEEAKQEFDNSVCKVYSFSILAVEEE